MGTGAGKKQKARCCGAASFTDHSENSLRNKRGVPVPRLWTTLNIADNTVFESIHKESTQVSASALNGRKFLTSSVAHLETMAYTTDTLKLTYIS